MTFRISEFLSHPLAIYRLSNFLSESQYWSVRMRRDWQQEQLERTLRYAVKYVPYYIRTLAPFENRFNEMIDRLDISELPCISRDTLKTHFEEFQSTDRSLNNYRVVKTRGKTDSPALFVVDKNSDIAQFAALWQVQNWAGYRFGDPILNICRSAGKSRRPIGWDLRQSSLTFPIQHLAKTHLPQYIKAIQNFEPALINALPSVLAKLSEWLLESGAFFYPPKAIIAHGEAMKDSQRSVIRSAFRCPLFDCYGQKERAALISTCEEGNHHIHEEYSWVEIEPEEDLTLDIGGDLGEIVATTYHNLAMPLIRFRTGDLVGVGSKLPCSCGRTYRRSTSIKGRKASVMVAQKNAFLQQRPRLNGRNLASPQQAAGLL